RPQSQGTEADSARRLLPCLDAGRFAPALTGPGLAPAVDLDVEAAADLDLPVQQLLGAAVEGVLPASHEVRGFEVPVAIGALEPPRREGSGERRGAVVRWIGHISNLTRRIPERRLTVRMAKVASSDRARMMPKTASVNRLSAQQLGEAAVARRGRNDPTRSRSPDAVETTRRGRGRPTGSKRPGETAVARHRRDAAQSAPNVARIKGEPECAHSTASTRSNRSSEPNSAPPSG